MKDSGPPKIIIELVERFQDNIDSYKSGKYNEAQARREFIDPFFEALGWDITNKQGFAEAYKDVINEDSIRVGKSTKAPDYAFCVGGIRKFFVEAKKPSVKIKEEVQPAYQLRRYAWSAKLPISILTDFEEFAIYDCQKKPYPNDKASTARIFYFTYKDYLDKWSEISNIFSKDAIQKGGFDRFLKDKKGRGSEQVDSEFLKEIEGWRNNIAVNLALRNNLTAREINYSVQKIIDRIVFLRICEDRGIENYGQLAALTNANKIYPRLVEKFHLADQKYNSGLFHFVTEKNQKEEPDTLTPKLTLDDQVLKGIFGSLYYPESPYEFSVLPADILGQVYEQFLGKVIRLTSENRIKIEEKPEVKKAGGVFYTPTFVVDYIVKTTIGEWLKGKIPKQAEKLKILDPSCGSGSFLLGAFQFLLEWHLNFYIKEGPAKYLKGKKPALVQISQDNWCLTTGEKKKILLNSIFGVDIDTQAVEVTKLSLLLKVLEGENEQTINRQMNLFHERALPSLGHNIKCGNALVASDFYSTIVSGTLNEDLRYRINPFDWDKEFAEIFKNGGFDVVIGNPPYVRQELLGEFKPYLQKNYKTYAGTADLFTYFFERGLGLLGEKGVFCVIVANKWMRAGYGSVLRSWLKNFKVLEIVDFGDLPVFQGATTYPCIIRISREKPAKNFKASNLETLSFESLEKHLKSCRFQMEIKALKDSGWTLGNFEHLCLLEKIKGLGVPLSAYVSGKIFLGIKTGLNQAFVIDLPTKENLIREDPKSAEVIRPFLAGRDIKRYAALSPNKFLICIPKGWTRIKSENHPLAWKWFESTYPGIARHLAPFEVACKKRHDKGEYWWELRACDYYPEFEKPKILYPDLGSKGEFTIDLKAGVYCANTGYFFVSSDLYLLGLLNSSTLNFFFKHTFAKYRGGFLRFFSEYVNLTPVIPVQKNLNLKSKIFEEVKNLMILKNKISVISIVQEKLMIQREIDAMSNRINCLVYQIYGFSSAETKIIESYTERAV